jgi:hypothetical protein
LRSNFLQTHESIQLTKTDGRGWNEKHENKL